MPWVSIGSELLSTLMPMDQHCKKFYRCKSLRLSGYSVHKAGPCGIKLLFQDLGNKLAD